MYELNKNRSNITYVAIVNSNITSSSRSASSLQKKLTISLITSLVGGVFN